MPAYEYRCRTCDSAFEMHRAMTDEAVDVRCPGGHADVTRVWSAVALTTGSVSAQSSAAPAPAGGCCGGGCCG